MNSTCIRIAGLEVVRSRRTLLAVERLEVERGEVLGVLGPNGAGKTTLLKCCVGFVRPSSGTVCVLGERVDRLGTAALTRLRRRVSYLAQVLAPGGEMPLTVREVVAIGRTGRAGLLLRLAREDWRLVDYWIERLGLPHLARQPYRVLSGGEQRKVLLAMAMVQEPEVLLLDEPTANLDVYWREQIVAAMEEVHRESSSLTIVLVSHDLEALPADTRRVLVVHEGRAAACGKAADVLNADRLAAIYGPSMSLVRHGSRLILVRAVQGGGS